MRTLRDSRIPRRFEGVIESIKDMIRLGEMKPGDQFPPERELAKRFAVSRNVLREAFRVLESRGFVEGRQGGGRFLRVLNIGGIINSDAHLVDIEKSALLDICESREILELKIVQMVVERATDEDIVKLIDLHKKLHITENYTSNIDDKDYDLEFHLALAEASHNFVLKEFVKFQMTLLKEMRQKDLLKIEVWKRLCDEHGNIIEKIINRDAEGAISEMRNHLWHLKQGIMEI